MSQVHRRTVPLLAAAAALAFAGAAAATDDTSYGYLRTVEGPGRIVQANSGAGVELAVNYPVLAGDLLEVDPGGRVEVSLPDFNVVRLAGGSELLLDRLALDAETEDDVTVLFLKRGELQFLVHDLLPVAERPQVDTANATIYLQSDGVYRIASDGYGWTEVVVRRGFAEIATESGASVVRSGEHAWIEGQRRPRVGIERAGLSDELERWGARIDGELAGVADAELEPHLAYAAAPLERHGRWVWVDGTRAWRPSVSLSWRPYEIGWWADTPSGLLWVSDEPWSWVTYHYGSWVPTPHYGWVWHPGRRFAPAWVYWYWGPRHVGWVPVGYYTGYYGSHWGRHGRSFRFGIYGWAGGSWSAFGDWTFCGRDSYRRRDLGRHLRRGSHYARDTRTLALERGLIGTDSRPAVRDEAVRKALPRTLDGGKSLPDVTAFVARQRELPETVSKRVFSERPAVRRDEPFEKPAATRGSEARPRALPRADLPKSGGDWREDSGRLRRPPAVAPLPRQPATAAPKAPSPPERRATGQQWWQDRGERATAPRKLVEPPRARGNASPPSDRDSVMRRIWERIGSRERTAPPAARPSERDKEAAAAPPPRRSATPKAPPAASGRRVPPQRRSSTSERPPRRQSSASGAKQSSSGGSSARSGDGGSSRGSSARSAKQSSKRSSDAGSRGRARRKPPS